MISNRLSVISLFLYLTFGTIPVHAQEAKGKEVPFTIDPKGGWLILSMTVDGKGPLKIVFDTGAEESFINPSSYRKHGLKQGKHQMKMGDLEFDSSKFQPDPNPIPGQDGIMGYEEISKYVFTLNIREKKLIFYDKASWQQPKIADGSTTKKVKYTPRLYDGKEGAIGLDVTVNDKGPIAVIVDTGSPAAIWVVASAARKLGLKVSEQPVDGKVKITDGVEVDQGKIMTMRAANLDHAASLLKIEGVLGGNFLKNFVVTFDTANKEVIFEPHAAKQDKK